MLPTALAREELFTFPLMAWFYTSLWDEDHGYTYPIGIIVQNHEVSVTNIES